MKVYQGINRGVFYEDQFCDAVNLRPILCKLNPNTLQGLKLLRSATPASYSKSDWLRLASVYRVKGLLDLRDISEVNKAPVGELTVGAGILYKNCPLCLERPLLREKAVPDVFDYADYYLSIIHKCGESIAELIKWIAEAKPFPLIVACFAGKDRTGVVVYLLLQLVHESWSVILNDYERSTPFLHRKLDYYSDKWIKKGLTRGHYINRFTANPKILELFHQAFEEQYGDVESYFGTLGIQDEVESIRRHLA